jgi:hypothetical protein
MQLVKLTWYVKSHLLRNVEYLNEHFSNIYLYFVMQFTCRTDEFCGGKIVNDNVSSAEQAPERLIVEHRW